MVKLPTGWHTVKLPTGWHTGQYGALDCVPLDRPVECADCDWKGQEEDLDIELPDIHCLSERIDAGSVVPVGECPGTVLCSKDGESVCGSLVYYTDIEVAYRRTPNALERLVEEA